MIYQDFTLDATGDLQITLGDFVIAPSDNQHIFDIITSVTGAFKEFPTLGCNIMTQLKGQDPNGAINIVKQQLASDGYNVSTAKAGIDKSGDLQVSFPNGISR